MSEPWLQIVLVAGLVAGLVAVLENLARRGLTVIWLVVVRRLADDGVSVGLCGGSAACR